MLFETAVEKIKTAFTKPLPGYAAQNKMAPQHRIVSEEGIKKESVHANKSAVLILVYPINGIAHTVFIERSAFGNHAGQISFAGGKTELTDKSSLETALREAREELGIETNNLEVIGKLTDIYIPPSNFLVYPYLAFCSLQPAFHFNNREVERILEIKLLDFLKPGIIKQEQFINSKKINVAAPCYYLYGVKIWGATAMMISELTEMLV